MNDLRRWGSHVKRAALSYAGNELIFGVSWDKSDTSTLIRTDASANMVANAGIDNQVVRNDLDHAPIFGEIKTVTDSYGNEFMRIPKFYIHKTDTENLKTWKVSKTKYNGFYLPYCFWDFTNNRELPYIDVGKYNASLSDNGLRLESKPNKYPLVDRTIVDFRNLATSNGTGYQQLDIHVVDILRTLFFIEFATIDSQSIGAGWTSGNYVETDTAAVAETATNRIIVANATANLYAVGQPISIGTSRGGNQICKDREITAIEVYDTDNKAIYFDGSPVNIAVGNFLYNSGWKSGFSNTITASSGSNVSNANAKYPFMYRGIENPFGNVWQWVDGININDNQSWICKDANQYVSNVFASPYEQIGYVNANTNGYINETGFDNTYPFVEIPISTQGSLIKYKDYYYQSSGQRVAPFGATWAKGSNAGLSYWSLSTSSSYTALDIGGRLVKKPLYH